MQRKKSHSKSLQVAELLKRDYAAKEKAGQKFDTIRELEKDEMIDLLDKNGNMLNKLKKRSRVHKDGDWHRTVHVWIITSKNEVLIQKRATEKLIYPDMWDISCAGHVDSGITSRISALREAKEELGINLSPLELKKVGTLRETKDLGDIHDNEIVDVYLVHRDIPVENCRLKKDEVSKVRLIQLADLKRCVENRDANLVPHTNEYLMMFKLFEESAEFKMLD